MSFRAQPNGQSRSYDGEYMRVGKKGEEVAIAWLKDNPHIVGYDDLRDLRPMYEADVDFSIKLVDGRVTLAEVKSDWRLGHSGNVLFEFLRINHTATPERCATLGWSARSPARVLLYLAPQFSNLYCCSFDDFRMAFQAYSKAARPNLNWRCVCTDNIKTTLNILIPWDYCKEVFTIYDVSAYMPQGDPEVEAACVEKQGSLFK